MAYNTNPDPYIDPTTGVLNNLLGITNEFKLETAEGNITTVILASLPDFPILGNFDLQHLKALHKELFSTIYSWAGLLRTVEIVKGNTRFANADTLEQASSGVFNELRSDNLLLDLPDEIYFKKLAHYYSEINILHPFREGNGRTQRVFFTLLVAKSGRRIAWENMNTEVNLEACIAAYNGHEEKLAKMLAALTTTKLT